MGRKGFLEKMDERQRQRLMRNGATPCRRLFLVRITRTFSYSNGYRYQEMQEVYFVNFMSKEKYSSQASIKQSRLE